MKKFPIQTFALVFLFVAILLHATEPGTEKIEVRRTRIVDSDEKAAALTLQYLKDGARYVSVSHPLRLFGDGDAHQWEVEAHFDK